MIFKKYFNEIKGYTDELHLAGERRRQEYLTENSNLKRGDCKPTNYKTVEDACSALLNFEGYAHIVVLGEIKQGEQIKNPNHAVAVYMSEDHVRFVDPNEGEILRKRSACRCDWDRATHQLVLHGVHARRIQGYPR